MKALVYSGTHDKEERETEKIKEKKKEKEERERDSVGGETANATTAETFSNLS